MPTTATHPNDDGNLIRLTIPPRPTVVVLREQVADMVLVEVVDPSPAFRATLARLQAALDKHQYTADLEHQLGVHLDPMR